MPKMTEEVVWLDFPERAKALYQRVKNIAVTQYDRYVNAGWRFSYSNLRVFLCN
jgi:hypothetical protein